MAGFKPSVHTKLKVYNGKQMLSQIYIHVNHRKTFLVKKRKQTNACDKKLLGLFVCLSMCVHVLMGVPVCKRLKCTHVNNKRAVLVRRTCVANLLRACKDHALICTVTGNNILT